MFLFRDWFPWTACYYRNHILSCGILAFVALSPNRKPSLGARIRNTLLTFCRRCMTVFIHFRLLLRILVIEITDHTILLNAVSADIILVPPLLVASLFFYLTLTLKKALYSSYIPVEIKIIIFIFTIEGLIIKTISRFFFSTLEFTEFGFLFNILLTISIIQVQRMINDKNIDLNTVLIVLFTNLGLYTLTYCFYSSYIEVTQVLLDSVYCLLLGLSPASLTLNLSYTPMDNNTAGPSRTGGVNRTEGSPEGNNGGNNENYVDLTTSSDESSINSDSDTDIALNEALTQANEEMNQCKTQVSQLKHSRLVSAFRTVLMRHFNLLHLLNPEMDRLDRLIKERDRLHNSITLTDRNLLADNL